MPLLILSQKMILNKSRDTLFLELEISLMMKINKKIVRDKVFSKKRLKNVQK